MRSFRKQGLAVLSLLAVLVASPGQTNAILSGVEQIPAETAITYEYDAQAQRWISEIKETLLQRGMQPKTTNTLILRLQADNPVQEIIFDGALIIGGAEPLFEIDGNPADTDNGTIRIGTLTFNRVDARRLEIVDTSVVSSNITNVVAHDNELALNTTTANVTFVGRGADSTLSFSNVRFDRVRILGPGGDADGHLERLTVNRSSVLGRIRIEDVKIQELVLTDVSLQD
ncbi:MAG: hypothetical protein HYX84_06970 [Chloroflexi bacterium]|nr:hypothetical protein [Chloroflexota bacterium]